MPGIVGVHFFIGSYYSGWEISQGFCLHTKWQGEGIHIQVPSRTTNLEQLEFVVQFLAFLHHHRG
jgi:hypothetical protein